MRPKQSNTIPGMLAGMLVMTLLLVLIYQLPPVKNRLAWRIDSFMTMVRMSARPVSAAVPTPVSGQPSGTGSQPAASQEPTATLPEPTATVQKTSRATVTRTPLPTATLPPTPTPTAIPGRVRLDPPRYEVQDWNNCGPATLSMYLRYFGWEGTQTEIADVVKGFREDRNVNIDELVQWVVDYVPDMSALYRVGGTTDMVRQLIAAGIPVMIEESLYLEERFWTNDDRWSGHYLLITGYDDALGVFTAQDSFTGPNKLYNYADLDKTWQSFNRAYILVYRPDQSGTVQAILGEDWDVERNRQRALETAQAETEEEPDNPFAWFNLGTNQAYFQDYQTAARSYDQARALELPQRMLRYQFGPFLAYFHAGRNDDLLALTEYALEITPNSEEALLWRGWAMYRAGDTNQAYSLFNQALAARPGYPDAAYALSYLGGN